MDQNNVPSSRPRTLDSVGGTRPGSRSVGSAHVIDLREKTSSFGSAASDQVQAPAAKPQPRKKVQRSKQPIAPPASAAATPLAPPASAASSPPVSAAPDKTPPVRASRQQERYSDAAFPDKNRFWPAFWRFLFLLVLLGLIIALSFYIYFSYYQQG